uniref:Snake toxin/toxin-like domain-containing protein n=1 Tax=Strix occidentalis caurina TaxID=311401 RepID=A0A8D0ETE2_STROC
CLSFLPVIFCISYPFMCYVCQEQESNKNCLTISMCAKEDKYCVTFHNNVGTSIGCICSGDSCLAFFYSPMQI